MEAMMSATTTYRTLVIASALAAAICMALPLVEAGSPSVIQVSILAVSGLLIVIWSVGLFFYYRWARLLSLISVVFVLLPMPGEPQVFSWPRRYFYDLSVFCFGAMIAMAFFSSVKQRFAPIYVELPNRKMPDVTQESS